METNIELALLGPRHAGPLAELLTKDTRLTTAMGSTPGEETPENFLTRYADWQARTNSVTYAIIREGDPIGVISLSKRNAEEMSACIGYWIASAHWNKGIGTRAFGMLLAQGRKEGFRIFRASITKDNPASLRIWQKHGAAVTDGDGRYRVEIRDA